MTLDTFITKYNGKKVEYHSYSSGALYQCTDLANQYIVEVLNLTPIIGTNAQDFPTKRGNEFNWIINTPDALPTKGALMIFKSTDGVGHISIFVEGNLNLFRSFDQNYPTGSPCKIVQHNYRNVLGWLTPIMPEKTYTQAEWQTERDERNKNWELYQATLTKISELEKNIADRAKATEEKDRQDQDYFDSLVVTLAPDPDEVKGMTTREIVKYEVNKFIDRESSLQKQIKELQKEKDEEVRSLNFTYQTKIRELEIKLGSAEETIDDLKVELDKLKELKPPTSQLPTEKPISPPFNGLSGLINSIKSVVRRILWLKK